MHQSRVPFITALFCGLLLHGEFTGVASASADLAGQSAPATGEAQPATPGGGATTPAPTPAPDRARAARRFEMADRDGDGRLTRTEAGHPETGLPVVAREFTAIDADGDGLLSKAELLRYARERRQARQPS
jgi:hypothetical protein